MRIGYYVARDAATAAFDHAAVRKLRQQRAIWEDPLVGVAMAERLAQPLAQRLGQAAHAHVLVEDLVCRVHGVVGCGVVGRECDA